MKRTLITILVLVILALILWFFLSSREAYCAPATDVRRTYDVIKVDAVITPPIAEYVERSIADTKKTGAEALIILLDTPGGLDQSMRDIVKAIISSPVPVIVYVHPSGRGRPRPALSLPLPPMSRPWRRGRISARPIPYRSGAARWTRR